MPRKYEPSKMQWVRMDYKQFGYAEFLTGEGAKELLIQIYEFTDSLVKGTEYTNTEFTDRMAKRMWEGIEENILDSFNKYEETRRKNTENRNAGKENNEGVTSGRPVVDHGSTYIQDNTDRQTDNTDRQTDNAETPPTLDAVKAKAGWLAEKYGLSVNHQSVAVKFHDSMSKSGWMASGQPVKNWERLLEIWLKNERTEQTQKTKKVTEQAYSQRQYDDDEYKLPKYMAEHLLKKV